MVRKLRRPKRVLVSLFVVLLMCVGPSAQAFDTVPANEPAMMEGLEGLGPSLAPEPDARRLLSDIGGFFTENKGQLGEGAGLYYFTPFCSLRAWMGRL
jgi:hypothetical protein